MEERRGATPNNKQMKKKNKMNWSGETYQDFVDKLLLVEQDDLAVKTGHFVTETIDPHIQAQEIFHGKFLFFFFLNIYISARSRKSQERRKKKLDKEC